MGVGPRRTRHQIGRHDVMGYGWQSKRGARWLGSDSWSTFSVRGTRPFLAVKRTRRELDGAEKVDRGTGPPDGSVEVMGVGGRAALEV